MIRSACLYVAVLLALVPRPHAQAATTATEPPTIANEYVRASKITIAPKESVLIPESSRVRLLIADHDPVLSDVTDAARPSPIQGTVVILEVGRTYQFANNNDHAYSGLLLELQKSPGKILCTKGADCQWSIRAVGLIPDPFPILLSEHVTVFRIASPWIPEPNSLVVPSTDLFVAGKQQAAGEPLWMPTPLEITATAGANKTPAPPNTVISTFAAPEYFFEIAFYDHPFCFCKRVRAQ